MAAMGGGRINPHPCTDEDKDNFYMEVSNQVFVLNQALLSGAVDAFTFMETSGGTAGFWDEKVLNEDSYDVGSHQFVYWDIVAGQIRLFTDMGVGAGDNYTVKINAGSTPGYLESKIHADTWEASSTYDTADHFSVLAAPDSDAVRFYAPWNIIKNSAGDGSPGYLTAKHANTTATAFNGSLHKHVYINDTGSTLDFYLLSSDIQAVVTAMSIGAVRYCKISASATVNVATESGSNVVPGTTSGLVELVRNTGTGQLVPGSTLTNVFYPDPTPVSVISGRYKIGKLMPDNSDPTKLVLFDVSCYSFAD